MDVEIVAKRGTTDYLIAAGRGDALGQVDVPLGRVFSYSTGELAGEALPVSSIVARGYWEPTDDVDPATLDAVRAQVAPLLDRA